MSQGTRNDTECVPELPLVAMDLQREFLPQDVCYLKLAIHFKDTDYLNSVA